MKAAVFKDIGVLAIDERDEPRIEAADDVLITVLACGICGTDLHILADPPAHPATKGIVLGHEMVGEVAAVGGSVEAVNVGSRVAVRPILTCGTCRQCLSGAPNHCERMDALGVYRDGGLAGAVVVPESACIPIDSSVEPHLAALTEPLACVLNAVTRAQPTPGEDVAVIGAGPIGLMFISLLRAAGAGRVAALEPSEVRGEIASRLGADTVIDPTEGDAAEAVRHLLPEGPSLVIDAVGSQLGTAIEMAGRRARVVLFGMNTRARPEIPQVVITEKELTVIGSYVGQHSFPDAVRLLESGVVDLAPMVSDIVPLDSVPSVMDRMRAGEVVKAVVTP